MPRRWGASGAHIPESSFLRPQRLETPTAQSQADLGSLVVLHTEVLVSEPVEVPLEPVCAAGRCWDAGVPGSNTIKR